MPARREGSAAPTAPESESPRPIRTARGIPRYAWLMGFAVLLMGALMSQADEASVKAVQALFDAQEKALRAGDEAACKALWHAEGWAKNLVGGSGIPGSDVFAQGSRKKWFPKPDFTRTAPVGQGGALLVDCEIWAWEKEKAVDRVVFLAVKGEKGWVLLGGGEKRAEVEALAGRWQKKQPLAPE